eukprot:8694772-Pyramimonas_sp.AAC.1
MAPFSEAEAGKVLKGLFESRWREPYGAPKYLERDAGRTNLGQDILDIFEKMGIEVTDAAGEVHARVGHGERHGAGGVAGLRASRDPGQELSAARP